MRVMGIDLGSREVKIVVMNENKIEIMEKISTVKFYRDYCNFDGTLSVDIEKLNITNIDKYISTGYGRNNTNLNKFEAINELKAHTYGAMYQTGFKEFNLLDVGGQDVKVMKIEKSIMVDMELNDKCAASCGRYLENMANVLEISVDELGTYHENPVKLNSTCAVFTESELIGKIAEGVSHEVLCASVNFSLYNRLKPMLNRFNSNILVLSGGVAHNKALLKYLENDYKEVVTIEEPQFNGAIGCCIFGNKSILKKLREEQ